MSNFGWNTMEADACFKPATGCDRTGLVLPVASYRHDAGCSITGGYVYRGTAMPSLVGTYIYGDYATGNIWALLFDADNKPAAPNAPAPRNW